MELSFAYLMTEKLGFDALGLGRKSLGMGNRVDNLGMGFLPNGGITKNLNLVIKDFA